MLAAGNTLIITVAVSVQPFVAVPVTVYVVLDEGLASGLEQPVQDRPAAGVQV
jgi:hypothetical protein